MSMPSSFDDDDHKERASIIARIRQGIRAVVVAAAEGRLALPVMLGATAIVLGLIGWSIEYFNGRIESVAGIIVRTIQSFFPSTTLLAESNKLTLVAIMLGTMATFLSLVVMSFATLRERIMRSYARYLWSNHVAVIGDTPIARQIAAEWRGERVLHVVAFDAPLTLEKGPVRVRLGTDAAVLMDAAGLRYAKRIIVDLGSDTATLSAGRILTHRFDNPPASLPVWQWLGRKPRRPDTLALRVAEPLLADQFFDVMDAEGREGAAAAALRPLVFDENRGIARLVLARHPLFKIAATSGHWRVHAVIIGFGDLGEKLLDQVMLTSIAGSLGAPRVTVLDRQATRRAAEFRARRPGVLDTLDIAFVDFDIGLDALEHVRDQSPAAKLDEIVAADAITAIFVALPIDGDVVRAVLLLRRHFQRTGVAAPPIFYRWRASPEADLLDDRVPSAAGTPAVVRMGLPRGLLEREITDPDGREVLARALHDDYRSGSHGSSASGKPWENLSDTFRRANIRAADHVAAKLWTIGIDLDPTDPARMPDFESSLAPLLSNAPRSPDIEAKIHDLARLEHERWSIDRKLDGWIYNAKRDNTRRWHNQLVPWDELKKSPEEVAKDANNVLATLRFVAERSKQNRAG